MLKQAILQVRMDVELKEQVEQLYKSVGTSFTEAVRIFARQSLIANGLPFEVKNHKGKTYGKLSSYANPDLVLQEDIAYNTAMAEKHAKID